MSSQSQGYYRTRPASASSRLNENLPRYSVDSASDGSLINPTLKGGGSSLNANSAHSSSQMLPANAVTVHNNIVPVYAPGSGLNLGLRRYTQDQNLVTFGSLSNTNAVQATNVTTSQVRASQPQTNPTVSESAHELSAHSSGRALSAVPAATLVTSVKTVSSLDIPSYTSVINDRVILATNSSRFVLTPTVSSNADSAVVGYATKTLTRVTGCVSQPSSTSGVSQPSSTSGTHVRPQSAGRGSIARSLSLKSGIATPISQDRVSTNLASGRGSSVIPLDQVTSARATVFPLFGAARSGPVLSGTAGAHTRSITGPSLLDTGVNLSNSTIVNSNTDEVLRGVDGYVVGAIHGLISGRIGPVSTGLTPGNFPVQMIRRSDSEKAASPERLNLDKRGLQFCCQLVGEERLRLLNYENNRIERISCLRDLPGLIFLDFYNNQIQEIGGLSDIPSLRVLMLGKNLIRQITNLSQLPRLDVLDLHSNRIKTLEIDCFGHLSCLRVLNLAGNQLTLLSLASFTGLPMLAELNLRRNIIIGIEGGGHGSGVLLSLQRLFLSGNRLGSLDSIAALKQLPSLTELSLDGNAVCADPKYRLSVTLICPTLTTLDQRPITDVLPTEPALIKPNQSATASVVSSVAARPLTNVVPTSSILPKNVDNMSNHVSVTRVRASPELASSTIDIAPALDMATPGRPKKEINDNARVARQQCVARIHNRFNTAVSGVTTSVSQGEEETLVEWNTSHTSLFICGPALNVLCDLLQLSPLQRALVPSSAMSVSAIAVTQATDALPSSVSSVIPISTMCDLTLQCIQFPALLSLLPLFASCLPRLKSLTLGQTHIQHLYQLEAIAVLPTLEVLVLQPNPVCVACPTQYALLAASLLPGLQRVDDIVLNHELRLRATLSLGYLTRLWNTRSGNLQKLACSSPISASIRPQLPAPSSTALGTSLVLETHSYSQLQSKHRKTARTFVDRLLIRTHELQSVMVDFELLFDQQLKQQKDRLSSVLQAQQSSSGLPSTLFERRRLDRMLERLLRECV